MECKKCGKEIKKNDKFCQYCGTKIEEGVKETKTESKKAEKVEAVKVEPVKTTSSDTNQSGKGLAIASMALGIVGLVFTFVFGPLAFILSLLGLIFAIVAKKKCGFKTAGLITSIAGIVLQVVATIIIVFFFTTFMAYVGKYIDSDLLDYYKNDSIYGTWTCEPYPSYSYTSTEETTLKLKYDGTFTYGPSDSLDTNHYSGTFTYESEDDKNLEYYSSGKKFYDVKGYVSEFMVNGTKESTYGKSLNMEIELTDDYDTAYIIFYNTSNTYKCER